MDKKLENKNTDNRTVKELLVESGNYSSEITLDKKYYLRFKGVIEAREHQLTGEFNVNFLSNQIKVELIEFNGNAIADIDDVYLDTTVEKVIQCGKAVIRFNKQIDFLTTFLSTALYGNSVFGATCKKEDRNEAKKFLLEVLGMKDPSREEILATILSTKKSIYIIEYEEVEDEGNEIYHELSYDKIKEGLKLYYEDPNSIFHNRKDLVEQGDLIDWDCVLQYAIFGEIIYG